MSSREQDQDADTDELRTPIVSVLGHVDHGKTTLLDKIRGSAVVEGESGAITQHIGSTVVPLDVIESICEDVNPSEFELPGLLFIDTPGHHAFTTLRSRGGSLSDIAVLVVDVTDGFQPQTKEAIRILGQYETPFVVAANKIDKITGWNPVEDADFSTTYSQQSERAQNELDESLYELIGELNDEGFTSDRYDRVQDFRNNIGVVPVSAETGEGIADLLMVLMGLAQRYLKKGLELHATGAGIGTVVEVKEEKGFGTTVDILLYDGVVEVGDKVVVGGERDAIVTEVRALLKPPELSEIRVEKEFERVDRVVAADGIKVAAPDLDEATAGAPFRVVGDREVDEVVEEVRDEMETAGVETEDEGIVVKADTVGSVEALGKTLSEAEVPVMKAEEGDVSKRDVVDASAADEQKHRAVLAFNVDILDDARDHAEEEFVEIFEGDVIYRLVEEYEEWAEGIESERAEKILDSVVLPSKFRILPDHTFRQNDPAVVGVEVLSGRIEKNVDVEKEGEVVGEVTGIQKQGEDIDAATAGDHVSVAIDGPTVGRQIEENDILRTSV
ncbi:MAG: translation initiation factor IF-2, partial [Halobacteria archaeon]|nr:translation initiation factor IF-2 [Halobacteria archaeon]